MSNHWSEDGDVLVHENSGTRTSGLILLGFGTAIIPFIATGWVAVAACLMLWTVFGIDAMTTAVRVEFDRRSGTMRQRNVLGLKSTDRLARFACVQVVRARSGRGWPQIWVNLKYDLDDHSARSGYLVAIYSLPGDADEKAARECADRLARFLRVPVHVEL